MATINTAQKTPDPCSFVIFGVTGDLAHRLVVPALYNLAATNLLPDKIDAGDRICERQLDRLMQRYQTSNPDFYGAYQVARIIVDAGGGSGTPPTPPPATPHP